MGPRNFEYKRLGFANQVKKLTLVFDAGILLVALLMVCTAYVLAKVN